MIVPLDVTRIAAKYALLAVTVVFYYFYAKRLLLSVAARITDRFETTTALSRADVRGMLELSLLAVSQACLCAIIAILVGLPFSELGLRVPSLVHMGEGMVLGIGEMGLSALLCRGVMGFALSFSLVTGASTLNSWLALARSGWMRHHIRTLEASPLVVSLGIILIQLSSEEVMFRGIYLGWRMPHEWEALSAVFAIACFCVVQIPQMPSWQAAVFPVMGALVMGTTHSLVFLRTHDLTPLIVAHFAFFTFAVI